METKIAVFQQAEGEGPDHLASLLEASGKRIEVMHAGTGFFPSPSEGYAGLVVLGGPMSVHSESAHPWLGAEKRAIESFLAADVPVLGICLGAQLVAHVLGAHVGRMDSPERGFQDIEVNEVGAGSGFLRPTAGRMRVFQWHDDEVDLPRGARRLAGSPACPNQVFLYGERVLGVQFHPEVARKTALQFKELDPLHGYRGEWVQREGELLRELPGLDAPQPVLARLLTLFG